MMPKDVYEKRRDDLAGDAEPGAGFDTSIVDDARLRQESPSVDGLQLTADEAELIAEMKKESEFKYMGDKWFADYIRDQRRARGQSSPNGENPSQVSPGGDDLQYLRNPSSWNQMRKKL